MATIPRGSLNTAAIAGSAIFSALALVLSAASQALGLNFPLIPYLQFDLGEVAIILAFFIFGPVPALISSLVEFGGLMVFGQQVPIGPLLKLVALVSTVSGMWVGARVSGRREGVSMGRLLGWSAAAGALFRAAAMTLPNYFLIVYLYGLEAIEGFLRAPFSLVGVSLGGPDAIAVILGFTAVFNVIQLAFVVAVSSFVLRFPAVPRLKVGGRAPWFVAVVKSGGGTPDGHAS